MSREATANITGTLTRDFELRFTNANKAVANSAVAVNDRRKDPQSGEWIDGDPSFYDITLWEKLAENASESLHKGDRVTLSGELKQETWESEAGDKRSKIVVVVQEIGPSLRWATATATKNPKGGSSAPQQQRQRPAPQPPVDFADPF